MLVTYSSKAVYHLLFVCISNCRINMIKFNFKLSTFFRDKVIEDGNSVHAQFDVQITLSNDQFSSMAVDVKLDSSLTRYCVNIRKGTITLDIVIIIILILSSLTYAKSIICTWILAKVLYLHTYMHVYFHSEP